MARRQWHTLIKKNCIREKITTKQYVRTCTATVENQLNVFYSLHQTISVEFRFIRSFDDHAQRRAAATIYAHCIAHILIVSMCLFNEYSNIVFSAIRRTDNGVFTQTHIHVQCAHTNNEAIRFGSPFLSRSQYIYIFQHHHMHRMVVVKLRSSLSIACHCLWMDSVRGTSDDVHMCWWRIRCEQEACLSMINSYLVDKGVYNFISSAVVSSSLFTVREFAFALSSQLL